MLKILCGQDFLYCIRGQNFRNDLKEIFYSCGISCAFLSGKKEELQSTTTEISRVCNLHKLILMELKDHIATQRNIENTQATNGKK